MLVFPIMFINSEFGALKFPNHVVPTSKSILLSQVVILFADGSGFQPSISCEVPTINKVRKHKQVAEYETISVTTNAVENKQK